MLRFAIRVAAWALVLRWIAYDFARAVERALR
jgi:hypothetical protein